MIQNFLYKVAAFNETAISPHGSMHAVIATQRIKV